MVKVSAFVIGLGLAVAACVGGGRAPNHPPDNTPPPAGASGTPMPSECQDYAAAMKKLLACSTPVELHDGTQRDLDNLTQQFAKPMTPDEVQSATTTCMNGTPAVTQEASDAGCGG